MEPLLRGVIADMDCIARPDAPVDGADSRFASLLGPVGSFPGHDRFGQPLQFFIAPAPTAGPANSVRLLVGAPQLPRRRTSRAPLFACVCSISISKARQFSLTRNLKNPPPAFAVEDRDVERLHRRVCQQARHRRTKADIRRGAFVEIVFRRVVEYAAANSCAFNRPAFHPRSRRRSVFRARAAPCPGHD
jgi:hypothetical protein